MTNRDDRVKCQGLMGWEVCFPNRIGDGPRRKDYPVPRVDVLPNGSSMEVDHSVVGKAVHEEHVSCISGRPMCHAVLNSRKALNKVRNHVVHIGKLCDERGALMWGEI